MSDESNRKVLALILVYIIAQFTGFVNTLSASFFYISFFFFRLYII